MDVLLIELLPHKDRCRSYSTCVFGYNYFISGVCRISPDGATCEVQSSFVGDG